MEAWTLILILLSIKSTPAGADDQFKVAGPTHPIVAVVGQDVVLDCQLEPSRLPDNMELRWINVALTYTSPVHVYKRGVEDLTLQASAYRGRTQLFIEQIPQGNLSLKLKNVRVSDEGQYKCFVVSKLVQNEVKITLNITDTGNQPWIEMVGYAKKGIILACRSEGWFPKPLIQWMDGNGVNMMVQPTTTYHEDSFGLYNVQSIIEVSQEPTNTYSCQINNMALKISKQVCIQISDNFFPQTSGWLVAFWILVVLVLVALGFAVWYHHKLQERINAVKRSAGALENDALRETIDNQQKLAEQEYERLRKEKENAVEAEKSKLQKLHQEFAEEKIAIRAAHEKQEKSFAEEREAASAKYDKLEAEFEQWRPLVKSEWARIRSHAVAVHPDPQTANGSMEVAAMKISTRAGEPLTVPDTPERFDSVPYVLGLEGFTTGSYFWEVEVASKGYWDIGVANESVEWKGMPTLSTDSGFWTFGRDGERYTVSNKSHSAITVTTRPAKIGVFLDLEVGKVSFYNADAMFHLHTFSANFSGKVYPFFSPGWSEAPLIIYPVKKVHKN